MTTITLTEYERIHLQALLLGEAQRLESLMQTLASPTIAKLQRDVYNQSREIYHKLLQ